MSPSKPTTESVNRAFDSKLVPLLLAFIGFLGSLVLIGGGFFANAAYDQIVDANKKLTSLGVAIIEIKGEVKMNAAEIERIKDDLAN